jgi:hypoxanthine phosphoribosyltransferase
MTTLLSAEQISARVKELALEIDEFYGGQEVVMIGVLRGCIHFFSDLARAMQTPSQFDFIQAMSYRGTESSGEVQLVKDLSQSIAGRNVLLVEDIYDTGRTLHYLVGNLRNRDPKRLDVATLLSKPTRRVLETEVRFVGFEIPDSFVVGYGLDLDGRYRDLPYIGIL